MGRSLAGDQRRPACRRVAMSSSRLPLQQQCRISLIDNGTAVYGTSDCIAHTSNADAANLGNWAAFNDFTAVGSFVAFQNQMPGQRLLARRWY